MALDSMTDGVATTFFARMDAAPQGAQRIVRRFAVPGHNGVAYRREEKAPKPFSGLSEVYVPTALYDAENAALTRAAYDTFVGKMVTLSIQDVDYPDIMVVSMRILPHVPLVSTYFAPQPTGVELSEDAYRVSAEWEFEYGGVVA